MWPEAAPVHRLDVEPTLQSIGSVRSRAAPAPSYWKRTMLVSGGSAWRPSATRKSIAYQSLHASPIAPACTAPMVELPSASTTSRFDRPWVYSWYTVSASSPTLVGENGSPSGYVVPGWCCRNICMVGACPSGGVLMLALSMWPPSGRPASVFAPSSVCVATASPPSPSPVAFFFWKLPAASLNPIGPRARWSCQLLTKKKTWVAFCLRFFFHEKGTSGFHEQGNGLSQNDTAGMWKGCSLYAQLCGLLGGTSSLACTASSSLTSENVCELLPFRVLALAPSQPFLVKSTFTGVPPGTCCGK